MSTYYEILQIPQNATEADIVSACDAQYHRYRRLVTHHDPEKADDATRKLRQLEEIRATLTDPAKRAAYDARLGISGAVSGLADPAARQRPGGSAALQPPGPASSTAPADRTDAWVCARCQMPNAIGAHYCAKCGAQIGRACPECNTMTPMNAQFCTKCGVDIEFSISARQKEQRKQKINHIQQEMRQHQVRLADLARLASINTVFALRFTKRGQEFQAMVRDAEGCAKNTYQLIAFFIGFLAIAFPMGVFFILSEYILLAFLLAMVTGVLAGFAINAFALVLIVKPMQAQEAADLQARIARLEQEARQLQAGALVESEGV